MSDRTFSMGLGAYGTWGHWETTKRHVVAWAQGLMEEGTLREKLGRPGGPAVWCRVGGHLCDQAGAVGLDGLPRGRLVPL